MFCDGQEEKDSSQSQPCLTSQHRYYSLLFTDKRRIPAVQLIFMSTCHSILYSQVLNNEIIVVFLFS